MKTEYKFWDLAKNRPLKTLAWVLQIDWVQRMQGRANRSEHGIEGIENSMVNKNKDKWEQEGKVVSIEANGLKCDVCF